MGTSGKKSESQRLRQLRLALREEREKVGRIPGLRKKWEYIWEYYKLWIVGTISAAALLVFFVLRLTSALREDWIFVLFVNTYGEVENGSELWDGYVAYTGYDTSEKNVVFRAHSYFDYNKSIIGNSYFEAFVAYADSGTLDAVTMEADSLTALGESGRLLDLDSPAAASIKEKYGDRFLYSVPYDTEYSTEPVAVGIDLSDSRLMTECHLYAESCALGIGAQSAHIQAVEQFLDYVLQ